MSIYNEQIRVNNDQLKEISKTINNLPRLEEIINDNSTAINRTWSSSKINQMINVKQGVAKNISADIPTELSTVVMENNVQNIINALSTKTENISKMPGPKGADGVSVTHNWDGTNLVLTSASGTTTTNLKGMDGKDGVDGVDGANGKDGISVTHSWDGSTLTLNSASGTTITNLKGDAGKNALINGKETIELIAGNNITFKNTEANGLIINAIGSSSVARAEDVIADVPVGLPGDTSANVQGVLNALTVKINNTSTQPGTPGKDGISVTHSWEGTKLTLTSASGTTTTDLKGDPGQDAFSAAQAGGYTGNESEFYSDLAGISGFAAWLNAY